MASVLMVTGAFAPEISGGGVQCRTMMQAIGSRATFSVLTTCTDRSLRAEDTIDGRQVTRVFVDVSRRSTKVVAALRTMAFFLRRHRDFQIVHLHGFSQKSILVTWLARLFGKKIVLTMHTAGQDDPEGVQRLGALAYRTYRSADRVIAISDAMAAHYRAARLPPERLRLAANGVDTERFAPVTEIARQQLRRQLGGLPIDVPWVAFVGYFSADKGPDVLYRAWVTLRQRTGREIGLLYAGATASPYHEVDAQLAIDIREDAAANEWAHLVRFTGEVAEVERIYQASDIFVMPSSREAFGMALVEAMATELPVIASAIGGVTDVIVDDGRTGVLVPARDPGAIADALQRLLDDPFHATTLGAAARRSVVERYGLNVSADRWLAIYAELGSA